MSSTEIMIIIVAAMNVVTAATVYVHARRLEIAKRAILMLIHHTGADKPQQQVNDIPKYHCPDCDDWSCLHCYCVDEPDCDACVEFAKGEGENK